MVYPNQSFCFFFAPLVDILADTCLCSTLQCIEAYGESNKPTVIYAGPSKREGRPPPPHPHPSLPVALCSRCATSSSPKICSHQKNPQTAPSPVPPLKTALSRLIPTQNISAPALFKILDPPLGLVNGDSARIPLNSQIRVLKGYHGFLRGQALPHNSTTGGDRSGIGHRTR